MTKRISQLTALTGVDLTDQVPLVDTSTGQTKKATVLEVKKNIYAFSAYRSANQTVVTSTLTKVQFETENFDYNSNYDAVTNFRYTAPVNGLYLFMGTVKNNGNGDMFCTMYKNGVETRDGTRSTIASGLTTSHVADLLALTAGDYVEIYVYMANTTVVGGSAATYFSGILQAPQ